MVREFALTIQRCKCGTLLPEQSSLAIAILLLVCLPWRGLLITSILPREAMLMAQYMYLIQLVEATSIRTMTLIVRYKHLLWRGHLMGSALPGVISVMFGCL